MLRAGMVHGMEWNGGFQVLEDENLFLHPSWPDPKHMVKRWRFFLKSHLGRDEGW